MFIEGLVTVPSGAGPRETLERLEREIVAWGLRVYARIDYEAGALSAGLELGSTILLIFGNGRVGAALLQADQRSAIDLPLKILVWQDAAAHTWLSYNAAEWIAHRHGFGDEVRGTVNMMAQALDEIAHRACKLPP